MKGSLYSTGGELVWLRVRLLVVSLTMFTYVFNVEQVRNLAYDVLMYMYVHTLLVPPCAERCSSVKPAERYLLSLVHVCVCVLCGGQLDSGRSAQLL